MLGFALYAGFAFAVGAATLCREAVAQAADGGETAPGPSRTPEPLARIAWGVRLNGSVGFAAMPDGNGLAGRVGVDGEYWFSENVAVGVEVGFDYLSTLNWCGGSTCTDAKASQASLAPAIRVRASNPTSFPIASLALGYAWGHSESRTTEDVGYTKSSGWATDAAVPYASLTAAWLFYPGQVRPGSGAFAWGPLVRLDCLPFAESVSHALSSGSFAWAFTAGMTLGLGVAKSPGC